MARPKNSAQHPGPTGTVRISRALWTELERHCPPGHSAAVLGAALEEWIAREFQAVPLEVLRLQDRGFGGEEPRPRPKKDAVTVRLPKGQCRRLAIIAPVRRRTVSELVEERLWAWLKAGQPSHESGPEREGEGARDRAGNCCHEIAGGGRL